MGEGLAHLSGPSLVIGDEIRQVPRVAQQSQPKKVKNSECEVGEYPAYMSGPSLDTVEGEL